MAQTIQFNVRTDPGVALAVRARARERGCALGKALSELVEAGRSCSEDAVVLHLDAELRRALVALAAVQGSSPRQVLDDALRGEVRRQLLRLADAVAPAGEGPLGAAPSSAQLPPPESLDAEDEVGLFTVFD